MPLRLALALHAMTLAEPRSFQLTYDATAGCPDRDAFVAAVEARLGPTHVDADAPVVVEVHIVAANGATGRVVLRAFGDETVRSATAATCKEVVDALALITAVALEASPSAPTTAASAPAATEAAAPGATPPAPTETPLPIADGPFELSPTETSDPAKRWGLVGLAAAQAVTTPGTGSALGFGGAFELWSDPRATRVLRLTVIQTDTLPLTDLAPRAWLRWTWARADGCPLRFGSAVMIHPCFGVSGGAIESGSDAIDSVGSRARPWLAIGAGVRVAAGGEPWFVTIDGGVVAPILRDTFVLERRGTSYRLPPVLLSFTAGLGLRFR